MTAEAAWHVTQFARSMVMLAESMKEECEAIERHVEVVFHDFQPERVSVHA